MADGRGSECRGGFLTGAVRIGGVRFLTVFVVGEGFHGALRGLGFETASNGGQVHEVQAFHPLELASVQGGYRESLFQRYTGNGEVTKADHRILGF